MQILDAASQICPSSDLYAYPSMAENASKLVLLLSEAIMLLHPVVSDDLGDGCSTLTALSLWQRWWRLLCDICLFSSKPGSPKPPEAAAGDGSAASAAAAVATTVLAESAQQLQQDLLSVLPLLSAKVSFAVQEALQQAAAIRTEKLSAPASGKLTQLGKQHSPLPGPAVAQPGQTAAVREEQQALGSSSTAPSHVHDDIEAACDAVSSQWAQLVAWMISHLGGEAAWHAVCVESITYESENIYNKAVSHSACH
jgi:hypothetical protein